ncbi:MAG: ribosomal protein L9p [Myxococcaceae bacterium]|nr:ribosomal protein L9p [Myxococcaceae bacterium]
MAHVRVVLREDVQHLGAVGELVRVRAGYARNFLLPRGKAALATAGSVRQIEDHKRVAIARAAKLKTAAEASATKLSSVSIEVTRQAGEGDKLYGSVTSKDVVEALKAKGYEVDKKDIVLPESIKDVGDYTVTVKLGSGIESKVKLVVKKK